MTTASGGRTPVVPTSVPLPDRNRPDPRLDSDIARWFDQDKRPSVPMITVLGEPAVRASGTAPAGDLDWYTEVLVHLALHPQGVTEEQVRRDLWPESADAPVGTVGEAIGGIRTWVGTDKVAKPPAPFVSEAPDDGRHRLRGHLLDWDLLERLRTRARGRAARNHPGALSDYRSALQLVRGPVLRTRAGYRWVGRNGHRWDRQILRSVIVTAHELVDLALAAEDLQAAQRAADLARRVDTGHAFDRPLTDLMRIAHARSNPAEVERLAGVLLDLRGVEVAEELAPVTFHVIDSLLPDGVTRAPRPARRRTGTPG